MNTDKDYFEKNKENFVELASKLIDDLCVSLKRNYNNNISKDKIEEILANIKERLKDIESDQSLKYSFNILFEGIMSYHESCNKEDYSKTKLSEKKRNKYNKKRSLFKSKILDCIKVISNNNNKKDFKNFYYFWLTLSLMNIISEYSIDIPDNDENDEESKTIKNKNNNSRLFFLEKLIIKIESLFLIFSISDGIEVSFEDHSKHFYSHMLLFLQEKKYINSSEEIISFEGSIAYRVRYGLKIDENLNNKSHVSILNLISFKSKKIYENPINIIKNKKFKSETFPIKSYIVLSSDIFDIKFLIKINKRYSFLNNKKIKTNTNDKTIEESSIFINFCRTKASEAFSINLKYFEEIFEHLIKKIELPENINLNTEINKLYDLLINYKFVDSSKNKNNLQDILRLIEMINIYKIFKKKNKIYLSFFFDFRSRIYYDSICSLTNFKLSRFFLTSNDYTEEEINKIIENTKNTKSYETCLDLYDKYKDKFEKYLHSSFIEELEKDKKDYEGYIKVLIINILIYLGSIKKSKILSRKSGFSVSIEEFIEEGELILSEYSDYKQILEDIRDEEDYFKLKFSLDFLKTEFNIHKKYYIGLDFSASGHQLRFIQNVFKNIDNYKLININSNNNEWYDIYTFFIKEFINFFNSILNNDLISIQKLNNLNYKKLEEIKKDLKKDKIIEFSNNILDKTFKRSILKKSIMTTGYNVSFHQFKEYYKKEVEALNLIKFKDLTNEEKNILNFILFLLYNFCNNPNLYLNLEIKNSNKDLELIISDLLNYKITHLDGFRTSFAAFKENKDDIRTIYWYKEDNKNKRITLKHKNYGNDIDIIKTKNSLMPNFIHSIDAVILRFILYLKWWSDTVYFTIHDEYWLPIQEKLLFIDHLNYIIKREFIIYEENSEKEKKFIDIKSINIIEKFKTLIKDLSKLKDDRIENFFSFFIII